MLSSTLQQLQQIKRWVCAWNDDQLRSCICSIEMH